MSESTAVAVKPLGAIIPESDTESMRSLSTLVDGFRSSIGDPTIASLEKMLIQARAIATLEQIIDDRMMADIMKLQGSPLGFKTDKDSSGGYSKDVVKRVVIVAWLLGANMTGNEVNIIASNCYLTKKFTYPQIMRTPGIRNFEFEIGVPMRLSDKTVAFDARARWAIEGVGQCDLSCVKEPNGMDGRIIVKAYDSSSPDELRGKAEAKLFQRVLQRITGIGLFDPDDSPSTTVDASASIVNTEPVEEGAEAPEDPGPKVSDAEAAKFFVDSFRDQVRLMASITDIRRAYDTQEKLIGTADWSDTMKQETLTAIKDAARERTDEIKATRGENSNKAKGG